MKIFTLCLLVSVLSFSYGQDSAANSQDKNRTQDSRKKLRSQPGAPWLGIMVS